LSPQHSVSPVAVTHIYRREGDDWKVVHEHSKWEGARRDRDQPAESVDRVAARGSLTLERSSVVQKDLGKRE
jgi:hypothetical protein